MQRFNRSYLIYDSVLEFLFKKIISLFSVLDFNYHVLGFSEEVIRDYCFGGWAFLCFGFGEGTLMCSVGSAVVAHWFRLPCHM